MPVYDFDCPQCGHTFEVVRGWNDNPATQCTKCGANARKRFSPPAIIYKGSGFYTTDYKNGSQSPKPAAKKPQDSTPPAKKETAPPKNSGNTTGKKP